VFLEFLFFLVVGVALHFGEDFAPLLLIV